MATKPTTLDTVKKQRTKPLHVEIDLLVSTPVQTPPKPETPRRKLTMWDDDDKRSKSTAPVNAALTQMLNQIQKKLEEKERRLSPSLLLKRHNERMEKAEKLKQQLNTTRKQMFEKARSRHLSAQEKLLKDLEQKRIALQQKLAIAQSRKETMLQNVQQRANIQIQRMEETQYINKLTKQNFQLDLQERMNDTEERRKQILNRKVSALKQQHEAADHKRRELGEENQRNIEMQTLKQTQAQQRRDQKYQVERLKASAEESKRQLVKSRKKQGHKILDIFQFVGDQEQLWDFVQVERDWQALGVQMDVLGPCDLDKVECERAEEILALIKKDQIELQKIILKRDFEILNCCIQFDSSGKMHIRYNPKQMMRHSGVRGNSADSSANSDSPIAQAALPQDEHFAAKLQSQRTKMSMRRNILRRTFSDDLFWAACQYTQETQAILLEKTTKQSRVRAGSFDMTMDSKNFQDQFAPDEILSAGDLDKPIGKKNKAKGKQKRRAKQSPTNTPLSVSARDLNKKDAKLLKQDSSGSLASYALQTVPRGEQRSIGSGLNQQSLDQLGPIVKMTLGGYPFSFQPSHVAAEQENQSTTLGTPSVMQSTASFQMNSLIMNQRPLLPSKLYASNLSKAASQYLFPIRDQKVLLMYPHDRQFAAARITVMLQEVIEQDCDQSEQSQNSSPQKQKSADMLLAQESLAKFLFVTSIQTLKVNESQKSLLFDSPDAEQVLKLMESEEVSFKYCRLCDMICEESHFTLKSHIKRRDELSLKQFEDLSLSMLVFQSFPGDIEAELQKEKEKALKRKVKRIKQQINNLTVSHENASTYPGKELTSSNKKRLQIRCIELEKSIYPLIQNYEVVEAILSDVTKVIEQKQAADLQLMRKLKFMPLLIEVCKRVSTCEKRDLKQLGKLLSPVIRVIGIFSSTRENRNYMYQTNRLMPLLELINWCINRTTQVFFGIDFLPALFQILTMHIRHRVPFECQAIKESFIDLLISSTITQKLKQKHYIVRQIPEHALVETLGTQVPHVLLKSITFLEALTAELSMDARSRPVYEKSVKIQEHVFFVIQNTEMFGIVHMISALLLSFNEPFKVSAPTPSMLATLPQTIMSLAVMSIKVLNNILRMDLYLVQNLILKESADQVYHLLHFLLSYAEANIDKPHASEDVKEMLHEVLLFIGYYSLNNQETQATLQNGSASILQKLCNLPFIYFMDKRNKDILYPTLIAAAFKNERALAILNQEVDIVVLHKFLEQNMQTDLSRIVEEHEYSDHAKTVSSQGSSSAASVQMDFLTGNNPYLPLVMRFPRQHWKEAIQFFR